MSSSEGTCPLQEPLCSGEEGLVVGHQTSYHSADPDPEAQISDAQSTPLTPLATSLNGNVPHTDDDEVEANGDGTKKKRVKLKGKSLRDLTTNQRNLLIALCILYFALYMLLSLIGPFFPIEAAKKGQTPFETGVVISMSWIVMFFMAPLVGFLGTKIKLHYLTTGGVAAAGIVCILFGLLQYVTHHDLFLALALILRLLEGMSTASFCVTAWSVLIATMGDCIQMTMAVLMVVQGVAVIVSPLLGGLLYAAGGFITPFVSLGTVVVLSTPLSWWVMRKVPEYEKTDLGSVKKFVSNAGVFLTSLFVTSFSLTFKFLESYVALYIKEKFNYGPQMAGIILSLACLSFVLTAIIWAQIIRLVGCVPVMVSGSVLGVIVMSFVAPGHFLAIDAHPWQVFTMTCLFGVAFAASQTPAVPRLLELARKRKMPETYLTYGLVSACYNSAFDLGCFIGPLAGGTMYNYIGFGWSTFSLGVMLTIIGLLVLLHHLWEIHHKKKGERSHLISSAPSPEQVDLNHISEKTQGGATSAPTSPSPGEKMIQRPRSMVELSRAAAFAAP